MADSQSESVPKKVIGEQAVEPDKVGVEECPLANK